MKKFLATAAAALLLPLAVHAAEANLTSDQFADKAGKAGLAEVTLSRLALEKSSDASVKEFAQTMVDDHSKANAELKRIAAEEGISVPASPGADHTAAAQKLGGLTDAEFDRAYADQMVEDHEKAVSLFKSASTADGVNDELRAFAKQTLPKLEHHLEEAQQLQQELGKSLSKR